MKQEQLKKIAEWYCGQEIILDCYNTKYGKYDIYSIDNKELLQDWQPHKDSNQLDMLKKKFIEELRKKYAYSLIEIRIRIGRNGCYDFKIFRDEECHWCLFIEEASSDNENECWLNAILNYVEGLK